MMILSTLHRWQNCRVVKVNKKDRDEFNKQVQRELGEVRRETATAYSLDRELEPVPDSAYDDAAFLLIMLPNNIPIPDIGWLIDGGIGFEWRLGKSKGIGTMSIYGDNQVIYGASLGSRRRVKGTCPLSDLILLPNFLKMASEVFRE